MGASQYLFIEARPRVGCMTSAIERPSAGAGLPLLLVVMMLLSVIQIPTDTPSSLANDPEPRATHTVMDAMLVKDIRTTGSGNTGAREFTEMGGDLYFSAHDGTNGYELWKSDGTESGTVMVKNIGYSSSSGDPSDMIAVGNTLYFTADDSTNGKELWKSDGTASGTVMVRDIHSGG